MTARVSWISLTPVKALALEQVDEIDLLEDGPRGDRRFYLIDDNDRLVNDHNGPLQLVHADYDAERELLSMRFVDGTFISGEVRRGDEVVTNFHRVPRPARRVEGPWDDPLSVVAGPTAVGAEPRHCSAKRPSRQSQVSSESDRSTAGGSG